MLCEKVTSKASEAALPNLFTGIPHTLVLKAYKMGIATGTSAATFEPKPYQLEQSAAVLLRAIKAIKPGGSYSIAGVKDFPAQKDLSGWEMEAKSIK